jgi:hypothetical protein
MAYNKVRGVVFADGTDRSDAINLAGQRYNLPPLILVGGAQMETGLGANRERWGNWPDVSFGDWQQTVLYAPIGDHTASDNNIAAVRDRLLNDWDFSLDVAAKQYGYYWNLYQDPLETFSRYNGGSGMSFADNPNASHIKDSWNSVQRYEVTDQGGGGAVDDWSPVDVRDDFPYREGNGEYPERDPASIDKVIYHHGDSRTPEDNPDDELALLHEYWELHTNPNDPNRAWPSIAYHMAIGHSGRCYYLNNINLVGYHAGDWPANLVSVGIVFLGNFEHDPPPPDMLQTAVHARLWVAQQLGRPDVNYFGHKEFTSTGCPGEWWPSQRGLLARLDDNWTPPEDGGASGGSYADLVSFYGWATGEGEQDLPQKLQAQVDQLHRVSTAKKVQDVANAGLQPIVNTLRRGGS